jgi:hypothetical protein
LASEETSKDNSSNNDKQNSQTTTTTSTEISDYRRKKNWISGVDNDTVTLGVAGVALATAMALAFPHIKEWVSNITNRGQQIAPPPPPQLEEPYIPPTEPLPPPSPQQPQPEQQPMQQEQQQQQQTEDIPDTFYDDELKKRREMITGRRHLKYDSQFGAGIANS